MDDFAVTSTDLNIAKARSRIRVKIPCGEKYLKLKNIIEKENLNTVCISAACPNVGECFSNGIATFMILGNRCTRACRFCGVAFSKKSIEPDKGEPLRVASAVLSMGINYVVVTSVSRDDLGDGGAMYFYKTVFLIKKLAPSVKVEVLVPDFNGKESFIDTVLKSNPFTFGHNIETVKRLSPYIRSGANYNRSLLVLSHARKKKPFINIKSGIMLGLGEVIIEIIETIEDLRFNGVNILTICQYLNPTIKHRSIYRYISKIEFCMLRDFAKNLGFLDVKSGPLVRSSYKANIFSI